MNKQSPININVSMDILDTHDASLSICWQNFNGCIENTGYLIRVYGDGGYIQFQEQRFEFIEFHFHTPSEHHINNRPFPMEIHFVHYNKTQDKYVVLAVFVDKNEKAHGELQNIIHHLPYIDTSPVFKVDPFAFLPKDTESLYYEGSLTTPPCLEAVSWQILHTPLYAQQQQIDVFSQLCGPNARPLQALNNRQIKKLTSLKVRENS